MSDDNPHMQSIRALYERKFYQSRKARDTLQKVLDFQQKVMSFKAQQRKQSISPQRSTIISLVEDENQFRPNAHLSVRKNHRSKLSSSSDSARIDGQPVSSLRVIMEKKPTGQMLIMRDASPGRKLMSVQEARKRWKAMTARGQKASDERLWPMNQFSHRQAMTSDEKIRVRRQQSSESSRRISRRVFIDGRDLEQVAEEYHKHYKDTSQQLKEEKLKSQAAQRQKKELMRKSLDRKKISGKATAGRRTVLHTGFKPVKDTSAAKTEPKSRVEEMMLNLDLDPWKVADPEYP